MFNTLKSAVALGLTATAAMLPVAASAAPLPTWYGSYVWEEPLGRVGGESRADSVAVFTTYRLSLQPAVRDTGCTVRIEGYQRYEQFKCTATPEGEKLIIKMFKLRPSDPGRAPLGTPMFTLIRTAGGGLVTQLQALTPSGDNTPSGGRFFRRG